MPAKGACENLKGRTFGKLLVLEFAGMKDRGATWKVRCACGTEKVVRAHSLKRTRSCGCSTEHHGMSTTGTYRTWAGMIQRCQNENLKSFLDYGGRGIRVCDRWKKSFSAFLADMGHRPPGTSLDRIDNDGNYEPDNCRWATRTEQNRNASRNVTLNGELQVDVARRLGVTHTAIIQRLRRWGDASRAATRPRRRSSTRVPARS